MTGKTLNLLALLVGCLVGAALGSNLPRWLGRRVAPPAALVDSIRVADTVYVRDTVRYAVVRDRYRTLRDGTTVVHDTALVFAADTALARCDTALAAGDHRVATRDTLIRALLAPRPRLDLTLEGTGSPVGALSPELRGTVAARLTTRFDAVAVSALRAHTHPELRIGVRWHLHP